MSFRPGWHLSDVPRAIQFDRINKNTKEKVFPDNFVWAKCEYVMDKNYQDEAMDRGYMRTKNTNGIVTEYRSKKFSYKFAGLNKLPNDGFYRYKTNPNKEALEFIITGQMKVIELLDDFEINKILKNNNIEPIHRDGGDKTLQELGINVNNL